MLSSSARRLQLAKERQHLTVRKKVRWCRAMPFQHFPKEIEIFKNARISVPTTRVFGKYPRVRQICPQMEKLIFLEIWKMNWGSAKATNHCGTFKYTMLLSQPVASPFEAASTHGNHIFLVLPSRFPVLTGTVLVHTCYYSAYVLQWQTSPRVFR